MGHTCHAGFVACIGNARLPRKSGERPPRIEACPQGCRNMLLGPHLWDHGCSALASQANCACQMIAGIMVAMPRPHEWERQWRTHGPICELWANEQQNGVGIDFVLLLVLNGFRGKELQCPDQTFGEPTSTLFSEICMTSMHASKSYLCFSSFTRLFILYTQSEEWKHVTKRESEGWRRSQKTAAHFFDVEDETSKCLKTNANTGRCLWISPCQPLC